MLSIDQNSLLTIQIEQVVIIDRFENTYSYGDKSRVRQNVVT